MTFTSKKIGPGATPGADFKDEDLTVREDHPQDIAALPVPHLSADEIAESRPAYALLLKSPSDRVSRRLFLSLHAAVKAAQRAEKRGSAVHLELVRLELHEGVLADEDR